MAINGPVPADISHALDEFGREPAVKRLTDALDALPSGLRQDLLRVTLERDPINASFGLSSGFHGLLVDARQAFTLAVAESFVSSSRPVPTGARRLTASEVYESVQAEAIDPIHLTLSPDGLVIHHLQSAYESNGIIRITYSFDGAEPLGGPSRTAPTC